jgi:hypothetical protein
MVFKTRYELADKLESHAVERLLVAVTGQKPSRGLYSEPIKKAAYDLEEGFTAGADYDQFDWIVDKRADDAIKTFVEALVGGDVADGPYSDDSLNPFRRKQ